MNYSMLADAWTWSFCLFTSQACFHPPVLIPGLVVEAWDLRFRVLLPWTLVPNTHCRFTLAAFSSRPPTSGQWWQLWIRSDKDFGVSFQHLLQRWVGLSVRVGLSRYIPPTSSSLYDNILLTILIPVSKMERLSPAFCLFLLLPLRDAFASPVVFDDDLGLRPCAFLVIFLSVNFSPTTRLLLLTIIAVVWCAQSFLWLATLRLRLETLDCAFFQRLDALIPFFFFGARFLLFSFDTDLPKRLYWVRLLATAALYNRQCNRRW